MDSVLVSIDNGLATVTINRPKALNALNADVMRGLDQTFESLANDDACAAVLVTGAGDKAFVAGADIKEMASLDPRGAKAMSAYGQEVFRKIENFSKPVFAYINGFALGGGLELAMACHMRFASEKARVGLPEITLGLIPGYGGTQRLPRLIGRGPALEMILTGKMINADEACKLGLLQREPLEKEAAMEVISGMLNSPMRQLKSARSFILEAVNRWSMGDQETGEAMESAFFGLVTATDNATEGMKAFMEKRKAEFKDE